MTCVFFTTEGLQFWKTFYFLFLWYLWSSTKDDTKTPKKRLLRKRRTHANDRNYGQQSYNYFWPLVIKLMNGKVQCHEILPELKKACILSCWVMSFCFQSHQEATWKYKRWQWTQFNLSNKIIFKHFKSTIFSSSCSGKWELIKCGEFKMNTDLWSSSSLSQIFWREQQEGIVFPCQRTKHTEKNNTRWIYSKSWSK